MSWIRDREPAVPAAFLPYLDESDVGSGEPEALAAAAVARLAGALELGPRDRTAAFHLLAADAWATWACEAAAEAVGVRQALGGVLDRVQERGAR